MCVFRLDCHGKQCCGFAALAIVDIKTVSVMTIAKLNREGIAVESEGL